MYMRMGLQLQAGLCAKAMGWEAAFSCRWQYTQCFAPASNLNENKTASINQEGDTFLNENQNSKGTTHDKYNVCMHTTTGAHMSLGNRRKSGWKILRTKPIWGGLK